jgi:hypothetical protein
MYNDFATKGIASLLDAAIFDYESSHRSDREETLRQDGSPVGRRISDALAHLCHAKIPAWMF